MVIVMVMVMIMIVVVPKFEEIFVDLVKRER